MSEQPSGGLTGRLKSKLKTTLLGTQNVNNTNTNINTNTSNTTNTSNATSNTTNTSNAASNTTNTSNATSNTANTSNATSNTSNATYDIGAVLNDPTRGSLLAQKLSYTTKSAVQSVPRANIRPVKLRELDDFLSDTADTFARYDALRSATLTADPVFLATSSLSDHDSDVVDLPPALFALLPANNNTSNTNTNTNNPNVNSLDAIPAVFFDADFSLASPRFFDAVTNNAAVATSAPTIAQPSNTPSTTHSNPMATNTNNNATSNAILQEKLSHYLDTVEVHLVAEIARRSAEFFAALANIQSLHAETLLCLSHVRSIRTALADVSNTQAKRGLEIVRLKKRRNNLNALATVVKKVKEVKMTQPMIQVLLNQSDYVGALDLIAETNRLLQPDTTAFHSTAAANLPAKKLTAVNLRHVKGLVHLAGQLAEMSKMIVSLMDGDFVATVMSDVSHAAKQCHDERGANWKWTETYLSGNESWKNAPYDLDESLQTRLMPLIFGLVRTERFSSALQTYREKMVKEVKMLTRQYFPPPLAEDAQTGQGKEVGSDTAILTRSVKAMTHDDFIVFIRRVFTSMLQFLKHLDMVHRVVTRVLSEAEQQGVRVGADKSFGGDSSPGPVDSPVKTSISNLTGPSSSSTTATTGMANVSFQMLVKETNDVLSAAVEVAHIRCGKLVMMRSEQHAMLNTKDFTVLYDMTNRFVDATRDMTNGGVVGMASSLVTLAKSFVNHYHSEKLKQLVMLIDNEQWTQAEVPVDFQTIVNRLTKTTKHVHKIQGPDMSDLDMTASLLDKKDEEEENTKSGGGMGLVVDGSEYHVVPCALMFIKLLDAYLALMTNLPSLTTDLLHRLVEATKLYNSRICGVIVGGAAVQTSVLKSITAKHLALAGQSLSVIVAILPHVKASVQVNLPEKQHILLSDFSKVALDFVHNRDQVHMRIVMIMQDRLVSHVEAIRAMQWDDAPTTEQDEGGTMDDHASGYMKNLVKEIIKLHRILKKYLFPDTVKAIFGEIFKVYNAKLDQELSKLELYSSNGKNRYVTSSSSVMTPCVGCHGGRVLLDVQFYISRLAMLDYVDGPGSSLEVTVNNLRIRDKKEPRTSQAGTVPASDSSQSISSQHHESGPTHSGHSQSTGSGTVGATATAASKLSSIKFPTSLQFGKSSAASSSIASSSNVGNSQQQQQQTQQQQQQATTSKISGALSSFSKFMNKEKLPAPQPQ